MYHQRIFFNLYTHICICVYIMHTHEFTFNQVDRISASIWLLTMLCFALRLAFPRCLKADHVNTEPIQQMIMHSTPYNVYIQKYIYVKYQVYQVCKQISYYMYMYSYIYIYINVYMHASIYKDTYTIFSNLCQGW